MAGFSVAVENAVLNMVLKNTAYPVGAGAYLSLHTGDPGKTGANEVVGGSYARQPVTWNNASSGSSTATASHDFTLLPAVTITHFGVWTALTGGSFIIGDATTNQVMSAGSTYTLSTATVNQN